MLTRRISNDTSHIADSVIVQNEDDSSNDESVPQRNIRKRVHRFSDSETDEKSVQNEDITSVEFKTTQHSDSDSENRLILLKSGIARSRIKLGESSSDSDSISRNGAVKNDEQQIRMANKRNKLKNKFKGLLSSREKQTASQTNGKQSSESSHSEISDPSDSEMSSIAKIKQKIKKSMASISSVCDPDTSDEEGHMNKKEIPKQRKRKEQKSTKLTEPKPIRMSTKQAMENMQLIKSESNRMLREKAVSLPYHRPKALSLKDIMSRRKPAVTLDGKALPIKMNEEQLKHYALLLDQRNKEIMELCKSESDEEEVPATEEQSVEINTIPDSLSTDCVSNNIESDISTEKATTESIKCMGNVTIDTTMDVDVNPDTEITQEGSVNTVPKLVEMLVSEQEANDLETVKLPDIETNNDGENKNNSDTELKLVYNDSVEDENVIMDKNESVFEEGTALNKEDDDSKDLQSKTDSVSKVDIVLNKEVDEGNLQINSEPEVTKVSTEPESQLISLHYTENETEAEKLHNPGNENSVRNDTAEEEKQEDFFSDDDVNMEDIDRIIENAEIMKDDDQMNSQALIDRPALTAKPKLMGAPGMVIDLDGGAFVPKKLTGVELLKERFTYFARLKTPEELEREREKKLKPGAQHLKLKQELEEQIAEQRSLEWAKRLEEEKQQHMEMETILDDAEDSFEKNEAKLENDDANDDDENTSESEEEELEENDVEIKDKPRKHNPMVDDEAEESDDEVNNDDTVNEAGEDIDDGDEEQQEADEENESSDDESSESEVEDTTTVKKSRILKAFEDSDDENVTISKQDEIGTVNKNTNELKAEDTSEISNVAPSFSQDDVIQLAQRHQSASDDLFTSQESSAVVEKSKNENSTSDEVLGTQTFSILDSTSRNNNMDMEFKSPSQINALCMSQPYHDPNLNAVVGSQLPITQSSQSQPIGEDILALCTGKFYDNEFVSLSEENQYVDGMSQKSLKINRYNDTQPDQQTVIDEVGKGDNEAKTANANEDAGIVESNEPEVSTKTKPDGNLLESILGELDDPEFDKPKPNKFFTGGNTQKEKVTDSTNVKKRFIIDSDDETTETNVETDKGKKKKLKKKKPEQRALQISDDEDDEEELEEEDDVMSDLEEDGERLVEYDSEENEIEIKPDKPKKKRKVADFFEQEAELTSEDEWVGSGDEDEKGLDRMEREAGDDEVFHQGKLRRELGQIHMRDVLDQDKREVRLIQELLFEDGDLGGGHRQRKFRWRNAGEGDDPGADNSEFADTQEEEFESEEQWRKQRHEREVFLRQMQQEEEGEGLNVSINRTTIIKANLSSKSMSTLLQEVNQSKIEKTESPDVQEKKTVKDIPSPKKSFSIFQQNYHGSLLTRGRGALARLAALATPLAVDDDAPKIGSVATHKRNFVFTALTPDDDVPKVTMKRKADVNLGTPKLMKKMKIEEKQNRPKSGLLDRLNL